LRELVQVFIAITQLLQREQAQSFRFSVSRENVELKLDKERTEKKIENKKAREELSR
jgi:hypothetical protein